MSLWMAARAFYCKNDDSSNIEFGQEFAVSDDASISDYEEEFYASREGAEFDAENCSHSSGDSTGLLEESHTPRINQDAVHRETTRGPASVEYINSHAPPSPPPPQQQQQQPQQGEEQEWQQGLLRHGGDQASPLITSTTSSSQFPHSGGNNGVRRSLSRSFTRAGTDGIEKPEQLPWQQHHSQQHPQQHPSHSHQQQRLLVREQKQGSNEPQLRPASDAAIKKTAAETRSAPQTGAFRHAASSDPWVATPPATAPTSTTTRHTPVSTALPPAPSNFCGIYSAAQQQRQQYPRQQQPQSPHRITSHSHSGWHLPYNHQQLKSHPHQEPQHSNPPASKSMYQSSGVYCTHCHTCAQQQQPPLTQQPQPQHQQPTWVPSPSRATDQCGHIKNRDPCPMQRQLQQGDCCRPLPTLNGCVASAGDGNGGGFLDGGGGADDVAAAARRQGSDLVAMADRLICAWRERYCQVEAVAGELRLELRLSQRRVSELEMALKAAVSERNAAIDRARAMERTCHENSGALTTERERANKAVEAARAADARAEQALAQAEIRGRSAEEARRVAEAAAAEAAAAATVAREKAAEAERRAQAAEAEVARLAEAMSVAEARAVASDGDVRHLREKYDSTIEAHHQAVAALRGEVEAARSAAAAAEAQLAIPVERLERMADLRRQLAESRAEVAALAVAVQESGAELAAKREALLTLQREVSRSSLAAAAAAAALHHQLAEATSARSDAAAKVSELEAQLAEAMGRGSLLQAEVESLGAKLLEAAEEMAVLQRRCAEAQSESARLTGDLERGAQLTVQLQRRIQCMCGQEEALAAQPLDALEALAAMSEAALPRVRHAIVAARVAAARSEAVEAAACAVCVAAARDTFLNCGHIICRVCAERIDRCPICRAEIVNRCRVFI